jgi:hypothetical protein
VLTIDYEVASAALEEAQGVSRIRQLDWAGRNAEEIAASASPTVGEAARAQVYSRE